jgi:hypothetical protein
MFCSFAPDLKTVLQPPLGVSVYWRGQAQKGGKQEAFSEKSPHRVHGCGMARLRIDCQCAGSTGVDSLSCWCGEWKWMMMALSH